MADRKLSVVWLMLYSMLILTRGLPTSTPGPTTSTPGPTTPTPGPTTSTPGSTTSTPGPTTSTPGSTTSTPGSTTSTPGSTTSTPGPTTSIPGPTTPTPGPTTSTPGPTTSTPGPTTSTPGPSTTPFAGRRKGEMTRGDPLPLPPSQTRGEEGSVAGEEDQLVTEFLLKYGYFRQGKPLHLQKRSSDADDRHRRTERGVPSENDMRSQAIRRFQSFAGLNPTGIADKETIRLMQKERCGVADLPEEETQPKPHHMTRDSQSPSDFSLMGSKWNNTKLTWKLDVPSNKLHPAKQRQTMQNAFATWAQVVPLTFREKRGRGAVDINIQFRSGPHGDSYPFDGRGKVLAHAFGPGQGDISGDMHMDNDEKWTLDSDQEISDLYLVATHELGHSLGLAHSRDPAALMYPYYGFTDTLGQDDIRAIQHLYGKRIGNPPVTPTPRRRRPTTTTTTPRPVTRFQWAKSATYAGDRQRDRNKPGCDVNFDVVFRDDDSRTGIFTGIRGGEVYRFNQNGLLDGYPTTLNSVYPGAPLNADAVFGLPEKNAAYFIKDGRVWRYTRFQLDRAYPKRLNPRHFGETIRFVLPVVDTSGNHRIFVFGTTKWLEYNFDALPSYVPTAHVIPQYWPYVATDVIYAVTGYDGNIYLISPHSHVALNSFRQAVHGGKKEGHPLWLQPMCHMSRFPSGTIRTHGTGATTFLAVFTALLLVFRDC